MIEKLTVREREVLEMMAACPYRFELKENLGVRIGWQTLENLCTRGFAVGGFCPVRPESHGWAITELGSRVLAAQQAHDQENRSSEELPLTAEQCRAGRDLLGWTCLDLAIRARCTVGSVQTFEAQGRISRTRIRNALRSALERGGAEFDDADTSALRLRSPVE